LQATYPAAESGIMTTHTLAAYALAARDEPGRVPIERLTQHIDRQSLEVGAPFALI
jgi:hypothetical protein